MSDVRLTEYENGSIGIYNGTTYKIVLEKHEVEALKLHFGVALPTEPGSYLDQLGRVASRAKLQDRIEELEKNLSYEVEQKIKLADTLRDERAKRPDRGRMAFALFLHESGQDEAFLRRVWEGYPAGHPVKLNYYGLADAAISSLALEPEAREYKLEQLAAVTNLNLITKAMLEEVGYPSHFHPADAPSWAYSVLEEEHEARTAPEAREERKLSGILARAEEVRQDDGWCIGGAWGDYGEVVVPIRILSYVIEGELDQKIASTDPGFALTYAEQERRAEEAEAKLAEAREVTSNETIPALERVGDAPTAVVREVTSNETIPALERVGDAPTAVVREVTSNETIPALERVGDAPTAVVREVTDAEVEAAYSAFVQTSFGFPGAPAMRAALEASREVADA